MSSWAGTAEAYRGSFATLCAGTIPELLAATRHPAPGPHLAAVARAAEDCAAVSVPSTRLDPALAFPRSVDGLAGLVRECGLEVAIARELRWTWRVSVPALLAGIRAGIAGPGRLYTAQSAPTRARLEQRIRELWSEHAEGGELAFPATAVLVLAAHG